MAWISVHEDVVGPKLRNMAQEVGCSQAEALGILNILWLWGLKNADQSGEIKYAGRADVATAIPQGMVGSNLNPIGIVDVLINTGWIDELNGVLFLHDWDEWQEQWYKFLGRKAFDADRKKEERRKKKEKLQLPAPDATPESAPPVQKPEKPQKKKYAEFVHLQIAEYDKLVSAYGQRGTDKFVEVLNNYKGAKGKTYKSDYMAILNWVVDRVSKDCPGLVKKKDDGTSSDQNPFRAWGEEHG